MHYTKEALLENVKHTSAWNCFYYLFTIYFIYFIYLTFLYTRLKIIR